MPAPPHVSGIGAPRYPSSPIFAKTSGCVSPRSSHARMFGRISTATNWRTDSRTSRFSSVRLKSITVALRAGGGQVRATSSHAARDVGRVVGRDRSGPCLLYTSDAADDLTRVDL